LFVIYVTPILAGGIAVKEKWDECRRLAKEGDFENIPSDLYIRHMTAIHNIHVRYGKAPANLIGDCDKINFWCYGPSGSGKSHWARTTYPDGYIKDASNQWWDGVNNKLDVTIVEDFDKYHVKQGHSLKIWADKYNFPAQTKGGSLKIRPKIVVVTSNYHPYDIWTDKATLEPICRRFKLVRFLKAGEVVEPHMDHPYDEVRQGYVKPVVDLLDYVTVLDTSLDVILNTSLL